MNYPIFPKLVLIDNNLLTSAFFLLVYQYILVGGVKKIQWQLLPFFSV